MVNTGESNEVLVVIGVPPVAVVNQFTVPCEGVAVIVPEVLPQILASVKDVIVGISFIVAVTGIRVPY